MAKLGAAFMLGGLATAATLLLVRGRHLKDWGSTLPDISPQRGGSR